MIGCRGLWQVFPGMFLVSVSGGNSVFFGRNSGHQLSLPGTYQLCLFAHLVGQVGQQVEDKVSHPLDELLQGLKGGAVQHKLLSLQID